MRVPHHPLSATHFLCQIIKLITNERSGNTHFLFIFNLNSQNALSLIQSGFDEQVGYPVQE